MAFLAPSFLRARRMRMLGAALALLVLSGPVLADDTPFDLESSSWMSFDRYKDQPSHWLAPDQRSAVEAQPVVAAPPVLPPSMPLVKDSVQPIQTPVMPGLNKNFNIKVDSTADDHIVPGLSDNPGAAPDMNLQDNEWKDAVEAAKQSTQDIAKPDKSDNASFNVRYSALPPWIKPADKSAPAMTPVPPKPAPAPVKIAQPVAPPPPAAPKPAMTAADAAACAALDAYKKHQLEAIQSDRQTLKALQDAIAQLGLQKQLDFLPGVSGSLNAAQAAGASTKKN
jgi:hypothetical protein